MTNYKLTKTDIENIEALQIDVIKSVIFEEGITKQFTLTSAKQMFVRNNYTNILIGFATAKGLELEELETQLDSHYLGSHDFKNMVRTHTATELYSVVKNYREVRSLLDSL